MSLGKPLSEGVVTPHRLCNNCILFWKSATCLRSTVAQLSGGEPVAPEMPQHLLHSTQYLEIKTGANNGCHFCSIILSICSGCTGSHDQSKQPNLDEPLYGSIQILNELEGSFSISLFACQQSQIFRHEQILNQSPLRLIPTKEKTNLPYHENIEEGNLSRLTKSTFSNASADLIRNWLGQCQNMHETCQTWSTISGQVTTARPRRLLDLRALNESEHIRLIENDTGIERSYCTLSYSWGCSRRFLMTSTNLSSFRQGIKVSDLPKTMQDVIEVTRSVGIRYLWVDALCIMQDGNTSEGFSDLVEQASIMNAIFSGSVLTIAASEAFGADEGFIQPRDPLRQTILNLSFDVEDLLYGVVPPCTPHCALHSFDSAQYHLDTRSWVLQERMLSPRTVHFTKNFVHLECRSFLICEGSQGLLEYESNCHHLGSGAKNTSDIFSFLGPGELPEFLVEYFLDSWHKIVRKYSTTNLSRQTDLLIALAGLASQLKGSFQLTPTFGLWKEYLLRGMLWYLRLGHGVLSGRGILCIGRAPSWSWACLDISGPQIFVEACLSVEVVATVLAVPETFEFTHLSPLHQDDSRYAVRISAPFKCGVPSNSFGLGSSSSLAMRNSIRTHPQCLNALHPECPFHPDYELPGDIQLYSVLIGRGSDGIGNTMTELGLVLTPVLGHRRRYRRVGYFHHSMKHPKDRPGHIPLASIFDGCRAQQVEII